MFAGGGMLGIGRAQRRCHRDAIAKRVSISDVLRARTSACSKGEGATKGVPRPGFNASRKPQENMHERHAHD